MIWIDPPKDYHGKFKHCSHLVSTDLESAELLAFARRVGLRPQWIQKPGTPHEHFDAFGTRRDACVRAGALEVQYQALGRLFRYKRFTMRRAKNEPITSDDLEEIEKFETFLGKVKNGTPQASAYAEIYGETIYETSDANRSRDP